MPLDFWLSIDIWHVKNSDYVDELNAKKDLYEVYVWFVNKKRLFIFFAWNKTISSVY